MQPWKTCLFAAVVAAMAAPAAADWVPEDGHKMHFPQLPDPFGWDVEVSSIDNQHECADDWQCSETGPVGDIHFWYSVALDGGTQIGYVEAVIYSDDPVGDSGKVGEDPNNPYSMPLDPLWSRTFTAATGDFVVLDPAGTGQQGFSDPQQGVWTPNDHFTYQLLNIAEIEDPFIQQAGEIYWLGLHVWWDGGAQEPVGWKTSLDAFQDAAVYRVASGGPWAPLDPAFGDTSIPARLDFAFVITPEPATLALCAAGGLLLLRRRR